jgi:hypothetical protein
MKSFQITSKAGQDFGVYPGDTSNAAFEAMVADGGAGGLEGTAADWHISEVEKWRAWLDGDRDSAVDFFAPLGGTFDIAEAAAKALGVEVSDSLNTERA